MTDKPLTDIPFSNFELHPDVLSGLERAGFTRCTPIQAMTLPLALSGRDIAGQAQTGTGKTLAFLVALVNRLLTRPALAERKPEDPRALILAPTRELAIQIHKDAQVFGAELGLRFALIYGGVDYDKQREILRAGADVIIATPGRLIDYVKQHKVVSLHACEVCVLDEADRMFDLGFIKDIRFLLRRMPPCTERQTLLFSATLSHRVLELAYEHMNEPEKMVVETESITAARVRQKVYFPANEEKIPLLIGLLSRSEAARTMVFVNTKVWVERVARALEKAGFRVGVLSGDVPQKKRETLLARFQRGQLDILVATDVAARGLHIDGISHVYNFDLPFDAEDYVHRIGRTARLGAEGDAISFACELYAPSLPDIEAFIEQKIPVAAYDPELLIPVERAKREAVEGEEVGESVSAIYREVREQAAAAGGGRGAPGRGGPSRSGSGRGPARGDSGRGGRGERPRRERSEAGQRSEPLVADAKSQPEASPAPAVVAAAPPEHAVQTDGEAAKRPRRRGGRRRRRPEDGGSAADAGSASATADSARTRPDGAVARADGAESKPRRRGSRPEPGAARKGSPETAEQRPAKQPAGGDKLSLMGRIKRRLGSLVKGSSGDNG